MQYQHKYYKDSILLDVLQINIIKFVHTCRFHNIYQVKKSTIDISIIIKIQPKKLITGVFVQNNRIE